MTNQILWPAAIGAMMMLAGCSDGDTSSGISDEDFQNGMNGSFTGSWLSNSTNGGDFDVTFVRDGNNVTGTVTRHTDTACPLNAFEGVASGEFGVTGTFKGNGNYVTWSGRLNDTNFSGPYRVTKGSCRGDVGNITTARL